MPEERAAGGTAAVGEDQSGPDRPSTGSGGTRTRRIPPGLLVGIVLIPLALLVFSCSGCSPVYVAKAGWAEMKILTGRRPFDEVIADPETDEETRRKILLARQARSFAIHKLGLDAGDSYTSFTQLESDTLAWVLSAAYADRLESKTWWFPIVGRVPYRGYAGEDSARKAEEELREEGFDTYLRTTSAFSTLGWFADPLLSSVLRSDDVELVTTILHEIAHNHLFVPGYVRFNESFATFVGRRGAIRFFCGPEGTPQTPHCATAIRRMDDYNNFSSYLQTFVERLEGVYAADTLTFQEKMEAREAILAQDREAFAEAIEAGYANLIAGFINRPVNNAIILARVRYFHRLRAFSRLLEDHEGDLSLAVAFLKDRVDTVDDPFDLLPPDDGIIIRGSS
jgi:predicted aminopeptidase